MIETFIGNVVALSTLCFFILLFFFFLMTPIVLSLKKNKNKTAKALIEIKGYFN